MLAAEPPTVALQTPGAPRLSMWGACPALAAAGSLCRLWWTCLQEWPAEYFMLARRQNMSRSCSAAFHQAECARGVLNTSEVTTGPMEFDDSM